MEAYLDNSATTKVFENVKNIMVETMTKDYGNPSSMHMRGVEAERYIRQSAKTIADILKVEEKEIIFTSGGTESNNLAVLGAAMANRRSGMHIITTAVEHASVHSPMEFLEEQGFRVTCLGVDALGVISLEELEHAICEDTILISVMYVNNEIGSVMPIDGIADIIRRKKPDILFHVDAIQAFGKFEIYPKRQHIDLLSVSGHKIHGPKGIGFLYVNNNLKLPSFLHGGQQEQGLRAGTENVPAIVGMGKAAELAYEKLKETQSQIAQLRDYMIYRLENEISFCHRNGPRVNRLANNVNFSFEFVEGEALVILLDMEGICASAGSACNAGQTTASHVIQALHIPDELARGTVRFTLSEDTTKEDIDDTVAALKKILEKNRALNPRYQAMIKIAP